MPETVVGVYWMCCYWFGKNLNLKEGICDERSAKSCGLIFVLFVQFCVCCVPENVCMGIHECGGGSCIDI